MSDDLRAAAHAAVDALADAFDGATSSGRACQAKLDAATTTNSGLLAAQGQDQATIKAQADQIADLTAKLAALQPKPSTLFGSTMNGTGMAEADALAKTLGVRALRVYDANHGPAWLYAQLMASKIHEKYRVIASAKYANPAAPTVAEIAATSQLLALDIDYIPNHEPDQAARVSPATWKALVTKVAEAKRNLGAQAKARIGMCLTGTSPARIPQYYPGPGIIDFVDIDAYSIHAGQTATELAEPWVDEVHDVDPKLGVGFGEFGNSTGMSQTVLAAFIASMADPSFLALGLDVACWYNFAGSVKLGNRIDNVPALAAAMKSLTS